MNHSGTGQPALPPPNPLQNPRSVGLIHQHRPQSPHQSQAFHGNPQGPYISPHSSTHSVSQHHSPYVGAVPGVAQHHPGETAFFGAHPSPYSTHSPAGSYASSGEPRAFTPENATHLFRNSPAGAMGGPYGLGLTGVSEPTDNMAAQTAISRQPYPPMQSSYQTPQSNSPASAIHSPQTDAHGRPLYGMPPMAQQMYYPQYQVPQQSPYAQPPQPSQHASMTSAPSMMLSHQQSQQQVSHQQQQPHQPSQPPPGIVDTKPQPPTLQRPPSVMGGPPSGPNTPSGPAPGPIPATTPLVVRQDNNGVQWIAFEYSRDRVKMEYTIRCDVESVNVDELSQDFKSNNCVYPRACVGKDTYKGNRLHYESECNAVGWALAQLNPCLREKRGLIQRAVDSWRNSNQDVKLRSRRVRRQAKIQNRKATHMPPSGGPLSAPSGPPSAGLPPQAENDYNHDGAPAHHHQAPPHGQGDLASPQTTPARYSQNFYPQYPGQPSGPGTGSSSMPSIHDSMDPMHHSQSSTLATPASAPKEPEDDEESKRALFGDVPGSKRRKFILVEDQQRGTRVRVRVMLDQVKMDDMPDAHLKTNSVYPRSYYPRQMRSPPGSPRGRGVWDDENDEMEGASGTAPTRGRTMVPVSLMDGSETKLSVPRMTKSRRSKEVALNELGYRMAWGQPRTFNGRTLFLQRSLDAYRNKMRSTMVAAGQDVSMIAPHFETRPGKRKWLERSKRARRADSP